MSIFSMVFWFGIFPFIINFGIFFYKYKKDYFSEYDYDENGVYKYICKKQVKNDLKDLVIASFIPIINIFYIIFNLFDSVLTFSPKYYLKKEKLNAIKKRSLLLKKGKKHSFLIQEYELFSNLTHEFSNDTVLDNKTMYDLLTPEEKYFFYEKVLTDLFKLEKIDEFSEEQKNIALSFVKSVNSKLYEIKNNRLNQFLVENEKPYLKVISEDEFSEISLLNKNCSKLKENYNFDSETNYLYEKIFKKISELEILAFDSGFSKKDYLEKIEEINKKISELENELKNNKKNQDKVLFNKIFSKYE